MNQDERDFLKSFYRAIPDGPLEPYDPRYWPIYDDPRLVRWDPVEQLARGIEWTDGGHIQMLAGSRGCGKSTELRRLARRLKEAGHHVALVDVDLPLEGPLEAPIRFLPSLQGLSSWLALVLARGVFHAFDHGIPRQYGHLLNLLKTALKRELGQVRAKRVLQASTFGDVFQVLSDRWLYLSKSDQLAPILMESLQQLVSVVEESAEGRVVVLVDSLDRLFRGENRLLRTHLEELRIHQLNWVLSVNAYTARDRLLWTHLHDEPRWIEPLETRKSDFAEVADAFSAHLAKLGDWRRLMGENQLRNVLKLSGGSFEDIFQFLGQVALNAKSLPPHRPLVETVTAKLREERASDLSEVDLGILRSVAAGRDLQDTVTESEELDRAARDLLIDGCILYRQDSGFFVHPLLAPTLERDLGVAGSGPLTVTGEADTAWPGDVLHLKHFRVENIRVFEEFQLEPRLPESDEEGQWTLLLGDNGVGKTTILRSLVLALADRRLADALFQLLGPSAPFLRQAAEAGRVEVHLDGHTFGARLARDRRGIEKISDVLGSEVGFPIYAYGCQRGSALGGPDRDVTFRPLDDVRGLFDSTANLIHAETWLSRLHFAALEGGGADKEFFEAVRETLVKSLHGVDQLKVDKNGVWLEGPNVGRAPLAALSDGYITTAGWILDLIARWSDRYRKLGKPLDGDFRQSMSGLVLIDEIDLHLHPFWQVGVVADLRKLFPRLSFVATTHNPLTLLGARAGEVHVLRRDDDGRVVSAQHDIPPGTRTDQVLTGEWFGLPSTLDQDTLDLLDQHRQLLREGASRDDPSRTQLERELRRRLGTFADTSMDRMVQGIAASLMPEDFEELSPEERQALRKRILERARAARRGAA